MYIGRPRKTRSRKEIKQKDVVVHGSLMAVLRHRQPRELERPILKSQPSTGLAVHILLASEGLEGKRVN